MDNTKRPITHQGDLAKLPRALAPLIERPQWAVWRWTRKPNGKWQKPPLQALQPDRNASTSDPSTWADYEAALDAVQTGRADGISYVLTEADPFAAIDIDNCRDVNTRSIDVWAQNFLSTGRRSYSEVTPSGTGCRIWGLADGSCVNRKFTLEIDGKLVAAELFRRTGKALTITGLMLDPTIRELANIDEVVDWGLIWGERRKAAAIEAAAATAAAGNGFNSGNGSGYSVEQIEQIAREGAPAGENRSDVFHAVVGHYLGSGWGAEQIYAHLQQFPDGVGGRYLHEGRLSGEIARSAGKYGSTLLLSDANGWANGFEAKAPPPDSELDDDDLNGNDLGDLDDAERSISESDLEEDLDDEEPPTQGSAGNGSSALDSELDDELLDDELNEEEPPAQNPDLPPLYAHGDPDPRPLKSWLIKHLVSTCGHGLLSGQWGTGKTFVALDLAACVMTGQPFLGHTIKRQCGVLLIAAEGAGEVRLRLDAVIRAKCGGMERAPFRWYEDAPTLLQKGAAEKLIAMAKQADASLQAEFGLPLGLVIVDTLAACTGYTKVGEENDAAAGTAVMNILKAVAQATDCFVLGVAHFGKDLGKGTRGNSSREDAGDLVLACLGNREVSGNVTETKLAVRKHRGGRQGQVYPFTLRDVAAPELDEDGEPITTRVVDWLPASAAGNGAGGGTQSPRDPWAKSRRQDQRAAMLRLKRVLMEILADQGVDLPIPPDGPVVRMVDQDAARAAFYASTPATEGTAKQQQDRRRAQFNSALERAEEGRLIGIRQIRDVTYLWLSRPPSEGGEDQD